MTIRSSGPFTVGKVPLGLEHPAIHCFYFSIRASHFDVQVEPWLNGDWGWGLAAHTQIRWSPRVA